MTDNNENQEYTVGYKKPPAHTQFKTGQSGNAQGRKRPPNALKTDLLNELNSKIKIREGDRVRWITGQQALVKSLKTRAIKGDRHAVRDLLMLMARVIGMEGHDGPTAAEIREEDKLILETLFSRYQEGAKNGK